MSNEQGRILIAGRTFGRLSSLLAVGKLLADAEGHALHAVGLVPVPPARSLSTGALSARRLRERLDDKANPLGARSRVAVAHDIWAELATIAGETPKTLTLLDWHSEIPSSQLIKLPSDVAILKGKLPQRLNRILLPIRGGPHAELALRLALIIANARQAEITLLHATPASVRDDVLYRDFLNHLRAIPAITRWINVRGDAVAAIEQEAAEHQLIVMGAIARPTADGSPVGPTVGRVIDELRIPVIAARSRRPFPASVLASQPPVDYTISVVVDKWFAENSFHATEFEDLKQLVELKHKQGLTISLGLPALNEEATVGKVIRTIQKSLMEQAPLLDEIVLIDSNSTDRTVAIAQEMGVKVYKHPEILPERGTYRGKGEALWKSLAVMKGDIVGWIDTDIENIHPRFVYGIFGPLIREPRLMYSKGYYQRPLKSGNKLIEAGGGRVTELVARPLLNLFYPELSGVVQPLSGEYAGRRSALMQIPFFSGYGVEIGMLLDVLNRFGLGAIAQVDLEERIHHSQTLTALSRMSFAIIQVVMQRVGDRQQLGLMQAMHQSLKQIRYGASQFELEVEDIRDVERPPMASIIGG